MTNAANTSATATTDRPETNRSEPALYVENLSVRIPTPRGTLKAVDDVSLQVGRGELLAILGESGCGKSTVARAMLGLSFGEGAEVDGKIVIAGNDMSDQGEKGWRSIRGGVISTIFQDSLAALNPVQTIGAQIAESIRVGGAGRKEAAARALELMADVGIPDPRRRAKVYPHQFSGGMRQRAMIAMALSRDPEVLIADEPTTALDVTVQAQILELLDRHRKERDMALVLISHDLGVVARHADRIMVLYAGRVVESGPTEQVIHEPDHPYTKGLLGAHASRKEGALPPKPIPGSPPDLTDLLLGCAFASRCSLVKATCEQRPPLFELTPTRTSACWATHEGMPHGR